MHRDYEQSCAKTAAAARRKHKEKQQRQLARRSLAVMLQSMRRGKKARSDVWRLIANRAHTEQLTKLKYVNSSDVHLCGWSAPRSRRIRAPIAPLPTPRAAAQQRLRQR